MAVNQALWYIRQRRTWHLDGVVDVCGAFGIPLYTKNEVPCVYLRVERFSFSGEAGYGIEEIDTVSGFSYISYQCARRDKRSIF
jgi:hypothetical protein